MGQVSLSSFEKKLRISKIVLHSSLSHGKVEDVMGREKAFA